jgi:hypothetical protein
LCFVKSGTSTDLLAEHQDLVDVVRMRRVAGYGVLHDFEDVRESARFIDIDVREASSCSAPPKLSRHSALTTADEVAW